MRSRINSLWITLLGSALLVAAVLVACGPTQPAAVPTTAPETAGGAEVVPTQTAPAAPDQGGYPAPSAPPTQSAEPYPGQGEAALPPTETPPISYPISTPEEIFMEPRFRLDKPLTAGATTVTGQAPPGLTLAIMDITFNGEPLGTGQSDESGQFSISVSPLQTNHRIGIAIAQLEEGLSGPEMAEKYFPYRGEEFMNLPNLGVFFDTAQVQP